MGTSKWPWIVGLGAAGAGMLVYLTRRSRQFEVVEAEAEDTVVVEQAEVPRTSRAMNPAAARKNPATMKNPITVRVRRSRKRLARRAHPGVSPLRGGRAYGSDVGWLGPVAVMGHAIQAQQAKFLYDRGHTSPFVPTRGDGGHPSVASRYTSKHSEFPSPVCPGAGVPRLYPFSKEYHNAPDAETKRWYLLNRGVLKLSRVCRPFEDAFESFAKHERMWGWGFDLPVLAALKTTNVARNNAQFDPSVGPTGADILNLKSYVDEVKVKTFYDIEYYQKARWLVWAAEMYREHYAYPASEVLAGTPQSTMKGGQRGSSSAAVTTLRSGERIANPPSEWRMYCAQWCVGIPTSERISQTSLLKGKCDGIRPEVVMQRIMEQIPPPGRRTLVEELASGALADWPTSLVQLGPPTKWFVGASEWTNYCHAVQEEKSGSKIERAFVKTLLAVELAALASYGAAAGGVVAGAVGGVMGAAAEATIKAVVDAAVNYAETGKTPTFKWSDALAVVGDKIDIGDTEFPSFEAAASYYNSARDAIDSAWGYGNDLMDAIEKEYMGILP
jgi:hypothetical protein